MWRDPIVEEIRKLREEYAARFNYDIKAICYEARKHQETSERKTVSLPPKRVASAASKERLQNT
jgi:hypothetical protein